MLKILLDFNEYKNISEIYNILSKELKFPDYFNFNLDSLYDILLDFVFDVEITIIDAHLYKNLYETLLDASLENEYINLNLG